MPELPEVQTVVSGLRDKVINKEISEIQEHRQNTVVWHTESDDFGKIVSIDRRGKYIIIHLSKAMKLIIHLRMTGKLIYEANPGKISSHARAEIIFSDNTKLIFDDIRTFGKIEVMHEDSTNNSVARLGVEPLGNDFTVNYLKDKIKNRKAPIKNLLLDQSIIAGLGNIYVAEILFRSKINPKISGDNIKKLDLKKIIKNTKEVLQEAIKCNGTTISDYRSIEDKTGEFQNFLKVYGKEYCECGEKISRIKQAGRTTFYCAKCQKK